MVPGAITKATIAALEAELVNRKTLFAEPISEAPKNALQIATAGVIDRRVALVTQVAACSCENAQKETGCAFSTFEGCTGAVRVLAMLI